MFVTLKEYVSMLSWVYICIGEGPKLENCFCSTPLVLCCSFSLKRGREIKRKRTGWVICIWAQIPDLSWWVGAWIKLNTLDFLTNYSCWSRKWFLPPSFTDHSHMFIWQGCALAWLCSLALSCWCSCWACTECQMHSLITYPFLPVFICQAESEIQNIFALNEHCAWDCLPQACPGFDDKGQPTSK